MKILCTNCITSTDKKVLTPFVKGSVYEAEPLIINGKTIPNEWLINGAERPHKNDSGWIAIAGWRSEERRVGKECRSRWSPYH